MPEISRFYGIVIRMYGLDHAPPHMHAVYGDTRPDRDRRHRSGSAADCRRAPGASSSSGRAAPGRAAGGVATGTAPRASGQDRPARMMLQQEASGGWPGGRSRKDECLAGQWLEQRAEAEHLDAKIEANQALWYG